MTEQVRPCPFCGQPPMTYKDADGLFAYCVTFGCAAVSADAVPVDKWNTRSVKDALRAENERLREALQKILDTTNEELTANVADVALSG